MEAIYSCSWSYGVHWLKETWHLFKRAPVVWLISGLICGLIFTIPEWFSFPLSHGLARLAVSLFMPVLSAGIIFMAYQCDQGSHIKVNGIFNGVPFFGSLIVMQLINIGLLLLGGGLLFAVYLALKMPLELIQFMRGGAILVLVIGIILIVSGFIFAGLSWFAPVLIVLGGQSPWIAMKTSLSGCLKSWQAWLVVLLGMGLVWIVFFLLFTLVGMLVMATGLLTAVQLKMVLMPVAGIALPVHALLMYIAYRDVFGEG